MSTDTSHPASTSQQSLTARTRRAIDESMTITACAPGAYLVESASGATYAVDLTPHPNANRTYTANCTCPDYTDREPTGGCKHLRRVKLDVAFGELRHPNDWPTDEDLAEREPSRPDGQPETAPTPLAADGGQVALPSENSDDSKPASGGQQHDPGPAFSTPIVVDETPFDGDLDTARGICYRIAKRIRSLNHEIDCRRTELRDLRTALSVFEELTDRSELTADSPGR